MVSVIFIHFEANISKSLLIISIFLWVLWWYRLIYCHFFQILWFFDRLFIFLRCKNGFGYLGLMQVCFTVGAGLSRFFRTHYILFPRVTYVLPFMLSLWKFCTVSNALLLLVHYYISYCMPYYTFSVK